MGIFLLYWFKSSRWEIRSLRVIVTSPANYTWPIFGLDAGFGKKSTFRQLFGSLHQTVLQCFDSDEESLRTVETLQSKELLLSPNICEV